MSEKTDLLENMKQQGSFDNPKQETAIALGLAVWVSIVFGLIFFKAFSATF